MPRVHRSKKSCATIGCHWGREPNKKHCSSCRQGQPVESLLDYMTKCNKYKKKVQNFVKKLCVPDHEFKKLIQGTNNEAIPFLTKVAKYEKRPMPLAKIMFTAEQVKPLMDSYYTCSVSHLPTQKECTINPHDKILGRVLDYWNLDFHPTIRCYWGHYGDFVKPVDFYKSRQKILGPGQLLNQLLYCAKERDILPDQIRKRNVAAIMLAFKLL